MLTLYYISLKRYNVATIILGIFLLIKQTIIFLVPLILIYVVFKSLEQDHKDFKIDYSRKNRVNILKFFSRFLKYIGLL